MELQGKDYTIKDIILIQFKYSPLNAMIMALQVIIESIVPSLQILVTAKFLDTAILVVSGKGNLRDIFMPLSIIIIFIAYNWISKQVVKFTEVRLELKLRGKLRVAITEKRAKLKYSYVENQDSWDLISRVSENPETKCKDAYKEVLAILSIILRIIGLLFVLATKVWWTPIVILLISIPLFYLSLKGGKAGYEAGRQVSKHQRKAQYLSEVLLGREAVDERSLFGYTSKVNKKWWEQYETARKSEYKVLLKYFIRMKASGIITTIISTLTVLVLIKPLQSGLITIGMFISIVNGTFNLISLTSWQITYYLYKLAESKEYLKDLSKFIILEETEEAIDKPSKNISELKSLEFKNVSFKYPDTNNYILKNLSFTIEEGKHYSFVGINGAGKTTITKLITGLYEDFEGDILINGINIKEYSHSDLKALCSVVYQDFAKYFISFKDNIALGNILDMGNEINEENIDKAIKTIELDNVVRELPKGVETSLGKIKSDGVDISGGEWQRIAMARSIISKAPLRILDEPTAALDPISESNVYEKFKEISRGGTTIFISHRLGSTKLADEIFVIGNGTIIEKGSHEELMNIKGSYEKMYESQRSWYV